ncbi:MAG: glycosyltransferase family 39 protein [Ignavibacteria bacterium]|nr:glycosyltransferase family 39 protein [Ignavibacteria bacterium]
MIRHFKENFYFYLIFFFAALLRIYDIETKNMWFDEIYSWRISLSGFIKIVAETSGDIHPPLFYFVLKIWIFVFSDSVFSMRMLSVVLSLASMILLWRLSLLLLGDKTQTALVLLLYALSPLNIFYSQEVRMLSLNLLLTLTSVFFFVRYIREPNGRTGVIYCIATALSLYTHYFASFILIAEVVCSAYLYIRHEDRRSSLKPFFKYPAFAFAMFMPWLPIMIGQTLKGQPWRSSQSVGEVAAAVFSYFQDMFLSVYHTYESMAVSYVSRVTSLLVTLFLFLCIMRTLNSRPLKLHPALTAVALFIIPFALAVTVSFRQSIVLSRYLSILAPYLFISLVYFSFRFYSKRTAAIMCILLCAVSAFGVSINYSNQFKNNDYRKVISWIERSYMSGDMIVVEPHFMGWSIDYHSRHSGNRLPSPSVLGWNLGMQLDSLGRIAGTRRFWMILDYSSMDRQGYDSVDVAVQRLGYKQVSEKSFYLVPDKVNVRLFEKAGGK